MRKSEMLDEMNYVCKMITSKVYNFVLPRRQAVDMPLYQPSIRETVIHTYDYDMEMHEYHISFFICTEW